MSGRIEWRTSIVLSGLHAAAAIVAGRTLADRRLTDALREPACDLDAVVVDWQRLLDAALDVATPDGPWNAELARPGASLPSLIGRVVDAVRTVVPRIAEELPLRVGPIRQQWEAYGPGFLARAEKSARHPWPDPPPRVVLVHPALGGGGSLHVERQAVRFEATLANPNPRLPETVRLGWLLLQLAAWPLFDSVPAPRRASSLAAVTVPIAVDAGQYVELLPLGRELVQEAAAAWLPETTL